MGFIALNVVIISVVFTIGSNRIAFCDDRFTTKSTVRTSSCVVLGLSKELKAGSRCPSCHSHRKVLNSLLLRHTKHRHDTCEPSSHTNYRYLNTPQKVERLHKFRSFVRVCHQKVERLKKRATAIIEEEGIAVDEEINEDLGSIMRENSPKITEKYPADSFARIFWEQQLKAASLKDARSMKWAPMMIRWCLYLHHLSSSAYETLRCSGAVRLPSQRTLRDYTHYTKASCGFSVEVDRQLMDAASVDSCPERENYIIILMDEMHIKENLVYNKYTGMNPSQLTILYYFTNSNT